MSRGDLRDPAIIYWPWISEQCGCFENSFLQSSAIALKHKDCTSPHRKWSVNTLVYIIHTKNLKLSIHSTTFLLLFASLFKCLKLNAVTKMEIYRVKLCLLAYHCTFVWNTLWGVKQLQLLPSPRQRCINTERKLCWFPSTQDPINSTPRRGERETQRC